MKKFILSVALVVTLVGCGPTNNTDDSSSSVVISSSSTVLSSSSVRAVPKAARLTMSIDKPMTLKRITIGGPLNKIISRTVDTLSDVQSETVVIDLGDSITKINYSLDYYLFSTGAPVRVDSVVVSDSLSFINKRMEGAVLSDKVGFTGDGIMPLVFINDTMTVGGVQHRRTRAVPHVDDTIVVTVYGTDTLGLQSRLIMKLAYRQTPSYEVVTAGLLMSAGSPLGLYCIKGRALDNRSDLMNAQAGRQRRLEGVTNEWHREEGDTSMYYCAPDVEVSQVSLSIQGVYYNF